MRTLVTMLIVAAAITAPAGGGLVAQQWNGDAHIVITGGAHAGAYDLKGTGICSVATDTTGAFQLGMLSSASAPGAREVRSLMIGGPDWRAARMSSPILRFSIGFGGTGMAAPPPPAIHYSWYRPTREGSGGVTFKFSDSLATVTLSARTADSIKFVVTASCRKAVRAGHVR